MFVDMKTLAIVPLVVAFALASVPEDTTVEAQCRAVSEVQGRGEMTRKIRYVQPGRGSDHETIQLIMPFQFPTDKPVTYAALAFNAGDVKDNCITSGRAVAKTVLFQPVHITPRLSLLVAWMTPASLLPASNHNILDHIVAVYRFDQFTEMAWAHFLHNYNDYRPIGCGKIHYADCDDDVTSIVSSMPRPTADKRMWAHVAADKTHDAPKSAEQPADTPISAEQPDDTSISAEQPHDTPISAEQPHDTPISAEQSEDTPISAEQLPDKLVSAEQLPDKLVSAEQLPDKLVSAEQLPDKLVSAEQLPDKLVSAEQLPDKLVSAEQLPDKLVSAEQLPDKLVSAEQLPDKLVSAKQLPDELVSAKRPYATRGRAKYQPEQSLLHRKIINSIAPIKQKISELKGKFKKFWDRL